MDLFSKVDLTGMTYIIVNGIRTTAPRFKLFCAIENYNLSHTTTKCRRLAIQNHTAIVAVENTSICTREIRPRHSQVAG